MTAGAGVSGAVTAFAVLVLVTGVLGAYGVRVALVGRIESARLDGERGTILLGRYPIEAFHWVVRAAGVGLARSGISPDALTIASLLVSAVTIPLVATGRFEAGGAVLLLGSAFDALDGIVARELGVASERGEMLDAVVDRYADACALVGLALFYRQSEGALVIVLGALVGSMMVSYVRAKAEALGISLSPGLMRRPERIACLAAGLLAGPALSFWLLPGDPTFPVSLAMVGLVGVVSNIAAFSLLRQARTRLLRTRSGDRS